MKFIGTDIEKDDLTKWILNKFKKFKITEIRYFGSRMHGRITSENSDIDVYILFDKKAPNGKPIFTEIYKYEGKNYQIEFHAFMDFHDGYIPSWLLNFNAPNEIEKK